MTDRHRPISRSHRLSGATLTAASSSIPADVAGTRRNVKVLHAVQPKRVDRSRGGRRVGRKKLEQRDVLFTLTRTGFVTLGRGSL